MLTGQRACLAREQHFHNGLIFELIVTLRNLVEHDVSVRVAVLQRYYCYFVNHLLLAFALGICMRPISIKQ
jgi:hypothetical protein